METKIQLNLSINHLVRFPAGYQPHGPATFPTVLALHGHGSNENDLISLAQYLPENLLWISGRGPVNFSAHGFDWYPVTEFGKPDPALLSVALGQIDGFITELLNTYPIDPQQLFLLGFSQGSMISMAYLLRFPERIKGVIAQSGYLPARETLQIDAKQVAGKPVIMTHGFEDPRMPLAWSQKTRDLLLGLGVDLTYLNFHMGHEITLESLKAIRGWMENHLQPAE